jgi:hypothetical protein
MVSVTVGRIPMGYYELIKSLKKIVNGAINCEQPRAKTARQSAMGLDISPIGVITRIEAIKLFSLGTWSRGSPKVRITRVGNARYPPLISFRSGWRVSYASRASRRPAKKDEDQRSARRAEIREELSTIPIPEDSNSLCWQKRAREDQVGCC